MKGGLGVRGANGPGHFMPLENNPCNLRDFVLWCNCNCNCNCKPHTPPYLPWDKCIIAIVRICVRGWVCRGGFNDLKKKLTKINLRPTIHPYTHWRGGEAYDNYDYDYDYNEAGWPANTLDKEE